MYWAFCLYWTQNCSWFPCPPLSYFIALSVNLDLHKPETFKISQWPDSRTVSTLSSSHCHCSKFRVSWQPPEAHPDLHLTREATRGHRNSGKHLRGNRNLGRRGPGQEAPTFCFQSFYKGTYRQESRNMSAASQSAKEFWRPFPLHLFLMITAENHMANKDLNSLPDEGICVL